VGGIRDRWHGSTGWRFGIYAVIILVPVVVLGLVLAANYRSEAQRRGLAEGRSEAVLMAQTAVQPILDGRPLSAGLSPVEQRDLRQMTDTAVASGNVRRFRLRDLSGRVVFSDDGSGFLQRPDDEALDAAAGRPVVQLTHLNSDAVDTGRVGTEAVEAYLPLTAGTPPHRVGVMEVYLPYAPIRAEVTAGLGSLYRNLAIGLGVLYIVLFGISLSVTRGLRRQVKLTAHLAEYDTLTDLPNRTLFLRRAQAAMERGRQRDRPTAIAIIDLDRFKEINDTLGHHTGDQLLIELGGRLSTQLRGVDALARLGGDEFGVILSNVSHAQEVLQRLRRVIAQEMVIGGLSLGVESSIGYAVAPDDASDVDELLQLADVAMYEGKRTHAGVVRYHREQDRYDAANLALASELGHAIDSDQLVLHYQPKVRLADGGVEGVEALVRWEHPLHGMLFPDRFIPLAERTDLIDPLTEWVVRQALADCARFNDPEASDLTVAVNVSARNLGKSGFAEQMVAALEESGIPPHRLSVEITETALMTDPTRAASVLATLRDVGISISIDDFGTGQTSLGYLCTLPISELKIDRGFIADMLESPTHAAIVRSIVELGHNLGFRVVGEGVESETILAALSATACDVAQGYLFARPMPAEQLVDWLDQARRRAAVAAVPS
jgi:diguanylate cyclase (GGDEF)-like protein